MTNLNLSHILEKRKTFAQIHTIHTNIYKKFGLNDLFILAFCIIIVQLIWTFKSDMIKAI